MLCFCSSQKALSCLTLFIYLGILSSAFVSAVQKSNCVRIFLGSVRFLKTLLVLYGICLYVSNCWKWSKFLPERDWQIIKCTSVPCSSRFQKTRNPSCKCFLHPWPRRPCKTFNKIYFPFSSCIVWPNQIINLCYCAFQRFVKFSGALHPISSFWDHITYSFL